MVVGIWRLWSENSAFAQTRHRLLCFHSSTLLHDWGYSGVVENSVLLVFFKFYDMIMTQFMGTPFHEVNKVELGGHR